MSSHELEERDSVVVELRASLSGGLSTLNYIPMGIERVIRDHMWQERIDRHTGNVERFATFDEFVEARPSRGLGTTVDKLLKLCEDRQDVVSLIEQVTQRARGNPTGVNQYNSGIGYSVTNSTKPRRAHGNDLLTSHRRLRKDRPDLHQRVINGELSANAAMIEAGFRKRTFTLPDDPVAAARTVRQHFDADELATFIHALLEES